MNTADTRPKVRYEILDKPPLSYVAIYAGYTTVGSSTTTLQEPLNEMDGYRCCVPMMSFHTQGTERTKEEKKKGKLGPTQGFLKSKPYIIETRDNIYTYTAKGYNANDKRRPSRRFRLPKFRCNRFQSSEANTRNHLRSSIQ